MNDENRSSANRLINEKSPYLLQHANNPVDWHPWCPEAFEKAKLEDKPVFLSIGYSTCHWCHVMEKESFEDAEVAKLMNETVVSIKVDREERPDIDNVYMTVCQMMTGHGGWPLSIVMTPDKKPFFSGTYFPKNSGYGRIGFTDLLRRINEAWKSKRDEIEVNASNITGALIEYSEDKDKGNSELSANDLDETYKFFKNRFDSSTGGFGDSPKFPSPHNLMFLLRYWKRTGNSNALNMATMTLTKMRHGGIFDQIGKGFHRYSTDKFWLLPHFEKMLYDQAMLAIAYLEAFQATGEKFYANTADDILEYVLRDMTSHEGGFYSAEDADSEGEEGKFYVWAAEEIFELLDKPDAELFFEVYNLKKDGNFNDESTGNSSGTNIPHLKEDVSKLAMRLGTNEAKLEERLVRIRQELFNERDKRIHPLKDDKMLTDWNGLMIAAMAIAGRVLDKSEYTAAAVKSVEFIQNNLTISDNSLIHRYREGESELNGFLDDYAFLIWGILELYTTTLEPKYLQQALVLQNKQNQLFWDPEYHGFFMTPDDAEKLIVRNKEIYDGAIPSGNSVSFNNLLKLSKITADSNYQKYADKLYKAFGGKVKNSPAGCTMFLNGLDFASGDTIEVVIAGNKEEDKHSDLVKIFFKEYLPGSVILFIGSDEKYKIINELAEFTKDHTTSGSEVSVYICKNYECSLPAKTIEEVMARLK